MGNITLARKFLCVPAGRLRAFAVYITVTALCKKVGGRRFGKFENKQDKIDPKLGFSPPGAR